MRKKILASSLADNYKIIVSGATETGKKHVLEREKNQDAVKTKCYGFGCVMALADGVGSHKFSRFGSRAIVQSVHRSFIDYVKGAFEDTYLAKILETILKLEYLENTNRSRQLPVFFQPIFMERVYFWAKLEMVYVFTVLMAIIIFLQKKKIHFLI